MNRRVVAIAVRCQLLTGSYEGASRSCPCTSAGDCQLSQQQREEAKNDSTVIRAAERNLAEFEGKELPLPLIPSDWEFQLKRTR